MNDIEQRIRRIADSALSLRGADLPADLAGELDSIQKLTLLVAIEDEFGIALSTNQDTEIQSLDDLMCCLRETLDVRSNATP